MATVAASAPSPLQPSRTSRRRSGNRSNSHGNENTEPLQSRINRFGFKNRPASADASGSMHANQDSPDGAERWTVAAGPPVDLQSMLCGVPTDAATAQRLLKTKIADNKWDFKAKISEQHDLIVQLKRALHSATERDTSMRSSVVAAEDDVNGRLRQLGEEIGRQTDSAAKLRRDLSESRRVAEEQKLALAKLRKGHATLTTEHEALVGRHAEEAKRAEGAEATVKARDERVAALEAEVVALKAASAAMAEKNATLTQQAAEAAAAHKADADAASTAAAETKAAAEAREASLSEQLSAAQARGATLDAQLGAAQAAKAELEKAHAELTAKHATLCEREAAASAKLAALSESMASKDAQLAQKDADLRESIQSITTMQQDNNKAIAHERERAQKLDDEAQALRAQAHELQSVAEAAKVAAAEAEQKALALEKSAADGAAALQQAESDRDRLVVETAELRATAQARGEELTRLQELAASSTRAAEAAKGEAAEAAEKLEASSREKHSLEVEYRSYKEHNGSSGASQVQAIAELKVSLDRLTKEVETKDTQVVEYKTVTVEQDGKVLELERQLRAAEKARRELHNNIQDLKGSIRVFCRVRPGGAGAEAALDCTEDKALRLTRQVESNGQVKSESYPFSFDKVFQPRSSQAEVFDEVEGLVQSSLDGYKVCIFAYGQTGSGKTFTMQGAKEPESWGLIPRSLTKILKEAEAMKSQGWVWTLTASFLEIYNEELRDLLHSGPAASARDYAIRHDDAWGTEVTNMTKVEVSSMAEIEKLMEQAGKKRSVGATDMNAASSRSHSVFALYLKGVNAERNEELRGALHLVDLAGSERVGKSGAEGERLKEAQSINKSLSSLTDVFVAKANGAGHVPFRNSKLTHLMQPCLSGQGKTLMVLNVGPEASNSHETLCSLRFASNVSQCDVGGKAKRSAKVAAVPERAAAPAASSAPSGSSGAATARPSTAGGKAPAAAGGRAPASGRPTTAPNKRQR